jgi:hypothetical protein
MSTRLTHARRLWVTAGFLVLLLGLLAGQVIATWDQPDNGYVGGFWDNSDEDLLLALVRDHSCGVLPEIALCSRVMAALPGGTPSAHSAQSVPRSSFDSRAPPHA